MSPQTEKLARELETVRTANPNEELVIDEAIEYAHSHRDSALHGRLNWDDASAAHEHRRHQMQQIIRAVYVEVNANRDPVHAYWSPPSHRNGENGYVHVSRVRTNEEIAEEIAFDTLKRIHSAWVDLEVVTDALPKLRVPTRTLGRAVEAFQRLLPPPKKDAAD